MGVSMRILEHQCIRKRFAELAQLHFHAPAPHRHRRPPAEVVKSRFIQAVEQQPCNSTLGYDREVAAKLAWLEQQLAEQRAAPQMRMEYSL